MLLLELEQAQEVEEHIEKKNAELGKENTKMNKEAKEQNNNMISKEIE